MTVGAGPQAQAIASSLKAKILEARGKAESLNTAGQNHANGGGEWEGADADRFLEHWEGPVGTALRQLPDMLDAIADEVDRKLGDIITAGGG